MGTSPETSNTVSGKPGRVNKLVFIGLFLPMVVLVVVLGNVIAKARLDAHINDLLEYDSVQLQLVSGFLGAEVLTALKHLQSITTEAVTLQALDSPEPAQLRALESSFLTLARRNPLYYQIRWIDEAGIERVRVTRERDGPVVVATGELQDKSERYYFKEGNRLLPGELYLSRIDLNEELGKTEMPPMPVLRIATPASGSDRQRSGILVINIEMKFLFEYIRTTDRSDLDVEYLLVNQEGLLLSGDFERELMPEEQAPDMEFMASHPHVWELVAANEEGNLAAEDGMWTWRKLSPINTFKRLTRIFPHHPVAFDQMISDNFSLTMLAHRPIETLENVRRGHLELIILGSIFVLSVYALTLAFYLSGTARARRAEVDAAHSKELVANMERMKELEERFHRLVEASSIGQLVVDEAGKIEISNPAAERMLGYERGELDGLHVEMLLPADLREQHMSHREQYMQAPKARRMGLGRNLQAIRKDGSTFPVEVGLSPYLDHDRPLILASIIDLSQPDYLELGEQPKH